MERPVIGQSGTFSPDFFRYSAIPDSSLSTSNPAQQMFTLYLNVKLVCELHHDSSPQLFRFLVD
jgi:hypothetical protein